MAINIFAQGQQAFDHSFDRTQGFYDQATRRKAGAKLATGDRTGAAADFGNAGMIPEARQMQADQFAVEDRQAGQAQEQKAEKAKRAQLLIGATKALKQLPWDPNSPTPAAARRQALSHPIFEMAGLPREELDKLTDQDLSDPALDMFVGAVERELQIVTRGDGGYDVVDKGTGDVVRSAKSTKPIEMDPAKRYLMPDDGGEDAGGVPDVPIATARPETDKLFSALIQQESGGRPGVQGPQTPYGRAEGMTQMLPATAEAMARKLGIPWNPALMRDQTPRGAAYQERLGKAYFEEGLQKYAGDPRKALMYYHGGPNEALWGPKTKAYAEQVLARVGGQDQMQGSEGGDRVAAPKGYRVVQEAQPKPVARWEDLPGGGQRNTETGETKNVPNPKPGKLSATALNQQNEHLGSLQTASAINTRLEKVVGQLDSGKLDLGVAKNIFAQGQNAIGLSSEPSRNYASFRADLEKLRNDSLRLNKGVQTDGDAQRAWAELFQTLNDPKAVRQRLKEIESYNQQAIAFHQDMVAQIREDSGLKPIDTSRFLARPLRTAKPPPAASGSAGAGNVIRYDAQGNRIK